MLNLFRKQFATSERDSTSESGTGVLTVLLTPSDQLLMASIETYTPLDTPLEVSLTEVV